ncbi:MAG: acyl-CoA dehydrogenase [Acidimicrobiia bacterium]|nr:acyl-CoA dehydrogenase [Acidimicrobiia bacterium]
MPRIADHPLIDDDLRAISDQVIAFCEAEVRPHVDEWEREGMVPRDVLRTMGDLGMFSLRWPEAHGGLGMGPISSAVLAESLGLASTSGGFDVTVLVHTDMASPHVMHVGNEEQLERLSPGILSGELITAVGVTEPDAGSDVAGIRTIAKKDGDGWRINGTKMFITNAVYGEVVFLAARTDPENRYGISMFIVEKGREGFSVAQKLDKHGWRCSDTAELVLDDVWVPDENLLGTPHRGFYEIMKNFQNERMVISAEAVGAAQAAIDMTLAHTQSRRAFGGVLFDKQVIRQRLAMAQAKVDACRAAVYQGAWMMESGLDATKYMSGVKAYVNETVMDVMYDCTQFHGGMGFMTETPVVRLYRDARINTIGGGATEVMLEEVAKRSIVV